MQETSKVIEVLTWVKDHTLWPARFRPTDKFVVPISNQLVEYQDLKPHQLRMALWVPSEDQFRPILKARGCELKTREVDGVYFAQMLAGLFEVSGVGTGPTEAILSALYRWRKGVVLSTC